MTTYNSKFEEDFKINRHGAMLTWRSLSGGGKYRIDLDLVDRGMHVVAVQIEGTEFDNDTASSE